MLRVIAVPFTVATLFAGVAVAAPVVFVFGWHPARLATAADRRTALKGFM